MPVRAKRSRASAMQEETLRRQRQRITYKQQPPPLRYGPLPPTAQPPCSCLQCQTAQRVAGTTGTAAPCSCVQCQTARLGTAGAVTPSQTVVAGSIAGSAAGQTSASWRWLSYAPPVQQPQYGISYATPQYGTSQARWVWKAPSTPPASPLFPQPPLPPRAWTVDVSVSTPPLPPPPPYTEHVAAAPAPAYEDAAQGGPSAYQPSSTSRPRPVLALPPATAPVPAPSPPSPRASPPARLQSDETDAAMGLVRISMSPSREASTSPIDLTESGRDSSPSPTLSPSPIPSAMQTQEQLHEPTSRPLVASDADAVVAAAAAAMALPTSTTRKYRGRGNVPPSKGTTAALEWRARDTFYIFFVHAEGSPDVDEQGHLPPHRETWEINGSKMFIQLVNARTQQVFLPTPTQQRRRLPLVQYTWHGMYDPRTGEPMRNSIDVALSIHTTKLTKYRHLHKESMDVVMRYAFRDFASWAERWGAMYVPHGITWRYQCVQRGAKRVSHPPTRLE